MKILSVRTPLPIAIILALALPPALTTAATTTTTTAPFAIHIVDAHTSRGIPLVTLETMLGTRYVSDSNGYVAFFEPAFMNQRLFFRPVSHGYEFPAPGLAMGGIALDTKPGTTATLVMNRTMLAERLYRITGAGIYRDSLALGLAPPIGHPQLNAGVVGQDSTLCTPYKGRIFWIWGDTSRLSHPLGNFGSTGAWSDFPTSGGLPIDTGVNLHYITTPDGEFVKPIMPHQPDDPTRVYWTSGLMTVPDAAGQERIVALVANIDGPSMKALKKRLVEFDPATEEFRPVTDWPDALEHGAHAVRYHARETSTTPAMDFIVLTNAQMQVRVPATYEAAIDPARYEKVDAYHLAPIDIETGKAIKPHGCSVAWNSYRQRWTMILSEIHGSSILGELYYLEAPDITGPWINAVKVVTHDDYTLYNPLQHPELTPADSPYLYFEGTYTKTFSGTREGTPWYDYNQIMYRVDLRDKRLQRLTDNDDHTPPAPKETGTL